MVFCPVPGFTRLFCCVTKSRILLYSLLTELRNREPFPFFGSGIHQPCKSSWSWADFVVVAKLLFCCCETWLTIHTFDAITRFHSQNPLQMHFAINFTGTGGEQMNYSLLLFGMAFWTQMSYLKSLFLRDHIRRFNGIHFSDKRL